MTQKPWILIVLAVLHILAPIANLFLNAVWSHEDFFTYVQLYFEPHNFSRNWLNLVLPMIAGVSIYLCKKWSFWVYLAAITGLFVKSSLAYMERAQEIPVSYLLAVYIGNILVVGFILLPTIRRIYFDPRLRWWETLPRYYLNQACEFVLDGKSLKGEIANFSRGGLFLKSSILPGDNAEITVNFKYDETNYSFKGHVIHHQGQNVVGCGLKFSGDAAQADAAKSLAQVLDKKGLIINHRTEGQSFLDWLKDLKKGKGLLPTLPSKK